VTSRCFSDRSDCQTWWSLSNTRGIQTGLTCPFKTYQIIGVDGSFLHERQTLLTML